MKNIIKRIATVAVAAMSAFVLVAEAGFGSNTHQIEASAAGFETAYFPGGVLQVTQGAYNQFNGYSHGSQNAFDLGGNSNYAAPFTGKIVSIYKDYNVVTLQSTNKVYYADGTLDYMTVSFVHDNNISDLYVGKTIKQGTVFYQPGVKDPTGKTTGTHLHIAVKRGRVNNYFFSGDVYPNDAFWLKKNTTIRQRGGYAWAVEYHPDIYDMRKHTIQEGGIFTIQPNGKQLYLTENGTRNLSNVSLGSSVTNSAKWKAMYDKNKRAWYFVNVASGRVLDINGQSVKSGQNVQIYDKNNCSTEYFIPKPNGYGSYILQTNNKQVAIDCYGSIQTLRSGSNVWTYSINYDNTQQFIFTRVG